MTKATSGKTSASSTRLANLLKRGESQGYVTQDDILELFPEAEENIEQLDELVVVTWWQRGVRRSSLRLWLFIFKRLANEPFPRLLQETQARLYSIRQFCSPTHQSYA